MDTTEHTRNIPTAQCLISAISGNHVEPRRVVRAVTGDAGELVAHGEERGISRVWSLVFSAGVFLERDGQRIATGETRGGL